MFETVAVLVVFFFLLVISLTFYFIFQKSATEQKVEIEFQRRAVETVQKMSRLPELDCMKTGIQIENCFDALKLNSFSRVIESRGEQALIDYYPIFGFSTITIQEHYPQESEPLLIYNNSLESRGYDLTQVPVLIFHPIEDFFSFALLEVKTYE